MTPDEMRAEAKRLYRQQVKERGHRKVILHGKPHKAPGPYVPTPEREARAAQIVYLRKAAHRG